MEDTLDLSLPDGVVAERPATYLIIRDSSCTSGFKIKCLKCNRTSYYEADVTNRYCSSCDWMHLLNRPREIADVKSHLQRLTGSRLSIH